MGAIWRGNSTAAAAAAVWRVQQGPKPGSTRTPHQARAMEVQAALPGQARAVPASRRISRTRWVAAGCHGVNPPSSQVVKGLHANVEALVHVCLQRPVPHLFGPEGIYRLHLAEQSCEETLEICPWHLLYCSTDFCSEGLSQMQLHWCLLIRGADELWHCCAEVIATRLLLGAHRTRRRIKVPPYLQSATC